MSQVSALGGRDPGRKVGREAYEALNYNQQLVQFADSKAGTLIVINSLFVAAMGATAPTAAGQEMVILRGLTVVAAAVAVVLCLTVVMTRPEDPGQSKRADLIFFDDILKRPSAAHYIAEFLRTPENVYIEDTLRRTYVVAGIAKRKFAAYATAQNMTAVSGVLWLLGHVITVLG